MDVLDSILEHAAHGAWERVVHRCAWCGRVADASGRYVPPPAVFDAATVFTDGMCPTCGARALTAVGARRGRRRNGCQLEATA